MSETRLVTNLGRSKFVGIECEACEFRRSGDNYEADRMAARRHAESNPGHRVVGVTERLISWQADRAR